MSSEVPSVWAWIAKQCHERKWPSSANVAEFLAAQEEELWGDQRRVMWAEHIKEVGMVMDMSYFPANFLVAVARCKDLKMGCLASGYNCLECRECKKHGVCNHAGSITHFWQYVLELDSGETIVEEYQETMKKHFDTW